jgi:hypothetical protein
MRKTGEMTNEKGRREMGEGDGKKKRKRKRKRKDFPPGMTIAGSLSPIVAKIL